MLSVPDFREKQIIFISCFDFKNFKFINSNFVIEDSEGNVVYKISCFRIFAIFIQGDFTVTSVLLRKSQEFGISIFLLNQNLSQYCSLNSETSGNYLLRERQYLANYTQVLSGKLIWNKIGNQIALIKEIRGKSVEMKNSLLRLKELQEKSLIQNDTAALMGIEGNAAKLFFKIYFKEMRWKKRLPRTKYDVPNLLLDIGYTYLFNFIDANLSLYGFDNYKGILHQPFYQRKSLVCDIMEPFRCIVDKALYKAYKLGQIDSKDFKVKNGQYNLAYKNSRKYSKIFLDEIISEKENIFKYIQDFYREFMKESGDLPVYIF